MIVICWLWGREAVPPLWHSCHKNIQDSLCIQFNNRKDRTIAQLWHKIISSFICLEFLPEYSMQLIHLSPVYASYSDFLYPSIPYFLPPHVTTVLATKVKRWKRAKTQWICCCSAVKIMQKEYFLTNLN